jgi:hypothetical protein
MVDQARSARADAPDLSTASAPPQMPEYPGDPQQRFARIPFASFDRYRLLSRSEMALLAWLLCWPDNGKPGGGWSWTYRQMSFGTGLHKDTVRRALSGLIGAGFLRLEPAPSTAYGRRIRHRQGDLYPPGPAQGVCSATQGGVQRDPGGVGRTTQGGCAARPTQHEKRHETKHETSPPLSSPAGQPGPPEHREPEAPRQSRREREEISLSSPLRAEAEAAAEPEAGARRGGVSDEEILPLVRRWAEIHGTKEPESYPVTSEWRRAVALASADGHTLGQMMEAIEGSGLDDFCLTQNSCPSWILRVPSKKDFRDNVARLAEFARAGVMGRMERQAASMGGTGGAFARIAIRRAKNQVAEERAKAAAEERRQRLAEVQDVLDEIEDATSSVGYRDRVGSQILDGQATPDQARALAEAVRGMTSQKAQTTVTRWLKTGALPPQEEPAPAAPSPAPASTAPEAPAPAPEAPPARDLPGQRAEAEPEVIDAPPILVTPAPDAPPILVTPAPTPDAAPPDPTPPPDPDDSPAWGPPQTPPRRDKRPGRARFRQPARLTETTDAQRARDEELKRRALAMLTEPEPLELAMGEDGPIITTGGPGEEDRAITTTGPSPRRRRDTNRGAA